MGAWRRRVLEEGKERGPIFVTSLWIPGKEGGTEREGKGEEGGRWIYALVTNDVVINNKGTGPLGGQPLPKSLRHCCPHV